jgi:hypothetical protein
MDMRTEVSNDLKVLFRFSLHTATALGKLFNDLEEVETLKHTYTHRLHTRYYCIFASNVSKRYVYLTNMSSKCDLIFETAKDSAETAAKYSIGGNEEFCGFAEAIFNKNVVHAY